MSSGDPGGGSIELQGGRQCRGIRKRLHLVLGDKQSAHIHCQPQTDNEGDRSNRHRDQHEASLAVIPAGLAAILAGRGHLIFETHPYDLPVFPGYTES